MLDKNVVRFTRNGIQEENLATGETKALTVSDYGKEIKYQNGESVYNGDSRTDTYTRRTQLPNLHLSRDPIIRNAADVQLPASPARFRVKKRTAVPLAADSTSIAATELRMRRRFQRAKEQQRQLEAEQAARLAPSDKPPVRRTSRNLVLSADNRAEKTAAHAGAMLRRTTERTYAYAGAESMPRIGGTAAGAAGAYTGPPAQTLRKGVAAGGGLRKGLAGNLLTLAGGQLRSRHGTGTAQDTNSATEAASTAGQTARRLSHAARLFAARQLSIRRQQARATQADEKGGVEAAKAGTEAVGKIGEISGRAASWIGGMLGAPVVAIILVIVIVFAIMAISFSSCNSNQNSTPLPQAVENYRPTVSFYAAEYGMTDYVDLILAVMAQESGGEGDDPMQAAEGEFNTEYPHKPNGIENAEYSIQCGIQELKKALQLAGCTSPYDLDKIKLALQGYNYGTGWFSYANGSYSEAKALAFSQMMAAKMGWSRYGDPQYVSHVLRYYRFNYSQPTGVFVWPVPGHTTLSSPYGQRNGEFHKGIDISDSSIYGAAIVAVADGTVTRAADGYGTGYLGCTDGGGWGNHAYIDHGNGYLTIYGHMSRCLVKAGDHVVAGQVIGYVGSSGSSTGKHLHFQVNQNGTPVNPMQFFTSQ